MHEPAACFAPYRDTFVSICAKFKLYDSVTGTRGLLYMLSTMTEHSSSQPLPLEFSHSSNARGCLLHTLSYAFVVFCVQRELYERVTGTEGVAVHVERYDGAEQPALVEGASKETAPAPGGSQRQWVSMAMANVLPKVRKDENHKQTPT